MNTRRELVRQYKEAGPAAGVYAIRNLAEGRVYLGASMNVEGALNRARFELRQRGHRHKALMADWLRLGEAQFAFEVVDVLKKRDDPAFDAKAELADLLQLWRTELHCGDESRLS
jgi:hypothetical protein